MLVALAKAEPRYQPMVVINWTPAALGLVRALAKVAPPAAEPPRDEQPRDEQPRDERPPVVCVGTKPAAIVEQALQDSSAWALFRYVEVPSLVEGIESLARALADQVRIADARSVIVLPDDDAEEPDAASRLTCAAVGRACTPEPVPNILVEVEDPEAAYEFAGLGVATVFYPGYLRAALLAHACVDLGVFQFVYGLLRGRYRVRLQPIPTKLRDGTFLDVALGVEHDGVDRPVTPIGLQLPPEEPGSDGHPALLINPGPRHSVRDALGILVLVEA